MCMLTVFPWLNVFLSCFKQLPLNFKYILLPVYFSAGASVLSGGVITSSGNPLDFHSYILSVLPIFFKIFVHWLNY